jgi:hypothetical protein
MAKRMTKREALSSFSMKVDAKPDAWMQLVLQTMGIEELRREIAKASGDELRWLQAELRKKEGGR